MDKNVEILDCTLRDGGRLFNCEFSDEMIRDVCLRMEDAHIDIIEVGFLRDEGTVSYNGNSTFFTSEKQIIPFLPLKNMRRSLYVAFIDYGLYEIEKLDNCDGTSIEGIRFGFTHRNLIEHYDEVIECMTSIKQKGYKLFVQNVNTPGYSDKELLDIIDAINKIKPYSYGIVDTYGSMYEEELSHFFYLVAKNLDKDIRIDFHSHNNFQMSFALAQKMVEMSELSERKIVIDGTLNGMGKGAGNLNLELIVDYLVRKKNYNYELDIILDIIDDYLKEIKTNYTWGYSLPGLFSGIYGCHPNNMLYLTDKFDLSSRDIKSILSMLDKEKRERYDYENLVRICEQYIDTKVDDSESITLLKNELQNKDVLLVMPGKSIYDYKSDIISYIGKNHPCVVSVNFFISGDKFTSDYVFFGSADRYKSFRDDAGFNRVILTSNIKKKDKNDIVVNYESLVERGNVNFDNSAIMCLHLLKRCGVNSIVFAGFDGYSDGGENYIRKEFQNELMPGKTVQMNSDIQDMLSRFSKSVKGEVNLAFITPSQFSINS